MLRIKSRPARQRPPTDEDLAFERRVIAAQMVGTRIINGVTATEVAEKMGHLEYRYRYVPFYRRWWLRATRWYWVPRKVLKLEEDLPDARLSTFQRYARAAGMKIGVELVKERPKQSLQARAAAIRRKRRLAGKKPRRRYATY